METTTDMNGLFCFKGLNPGNYKVWEIVPDDYYPTTDNPIWVKLGCGEEEWKQCEHHSCSRKDAEREASRLRDIGERTGRTRNVTIVPEIHRVAVTY